MNEERASRLMAKFSGQEEDAGVMAGGAGPTLASSTSASTPTGSTDGTLSQGGNPPDGPLRKKKRKHESISCPTCGYPNLSESITCMECGTRVQHEDFRDRAKAYRENLIEGKKVNESRVGGWFPQLLTQLLETARTESPFRTLDEVDQRELEMRIEQALADFVDWKTRRDCYGETSAS